MAGPRQYKNISLLNDRIARLREKSTQQEHGIRNTLKEIREDLRPVNIIKNSLNSITRDRKTRNTFLKTAAGFFIGILLKKYLGGKKETQGTNPVKEGLREGLVNAVVNNADRLKDIGSAILEQVLSGSGKKQNPEPDEQED